MVLVLSRLQSAHYRGAIARCCEIAAVPPHLDRCKAARELMPTFLYQAAAYAAAISPDDVQSESSRHVLGFALALQRHPDLWAA